ncbi:hypothetical protein [Tenacibaculum singaporense]|uniref:hypothetical protein n=1 Tax=Tenacibaculum singaporense TaxID=2358479 RepID=UPI000F678387|nr:hypothetical protein [Tenacibaculum singaporense]RSC96019.1 hypothetical protein EI424_02560 [Tenacibaculum singaporense]
MVEVFKTSVTLIEEEVFLLKKLRKKFPDYLINFDLEDCDNILRIEVTDTKINLISIIKLVESYGFNIEVLEDVLNI